MTSIRTRHLTALFLSVALGLPHASVQARAGSPAPAPKAAPVKAPAAPVKVATPAKVAPAPAPATATAAARAGGGNSVGMTRPEVMSKVRADEQRRPSATSQAQAPLAPSPAATPAGQSPQSLQSNQLAPSGRVSGYSNSDAEAVNLSRQAYERQRRNNMFKGAAAGAVVGGVTGYALGHDSTPTTRTSTVASQDFAERPGAVSDGPLVQDGPPRADTGISFARMFGWLVFLGLMAGIATILYRRWAAQRALTAANAYDATRYAVPSEESQLHSMAASLFIDIQNLNNAGDLEGLSSRTTEDMFAVFEADIRQRIRVSQTRVETLSARVVDMSRVGSRSLASVDYDAMISEGPDESAQPVREVWHFLREQGQAWRLAGIEQV